MDTHDTNPENYELTGAFHEPFKGEFYLAKRDCFAPKVSRATGREYGKRYIVVPKQRCCPQIDVPRNCEQTPNHKAQDALVGLLGDNDPAIRLQAAQTLLSYSGGILF